MARILLQFYKTDSHYYGNGAAFNHVLNVEVLPQVGDDFYYSEWMYNQMDEESKKIFTDQMFFKPGYYFVIAKKDWSEKEIDIDHSFFLIEEPNNRKSGFIDMKDIPLD